MSFITDPERLAPYLVDESSYQGFAEGLARVTTLEEARAALRAAAAAGLSVTFSARRTSVTGAAIPEGGLILALPEGSDPDLVGVDVEAMTLTAPAHVLIADAERAAERAGCFLPLDPTSRDSASVGGAVACNASGARSFGHGPTGAWVEGLVVVLADGSVHTLKRGDHPPRDGVFHLGDHRVPAPKPRRADLKTVQGYALSASHAPDVIDLFIGSEGTLGYIHEVTLRLLPKQPIFAALIFWPTRAALLDFVAQLQRRDPASGLAPMSVEYFDRRSLALAQAAQPRFGVPEGAEAALFIEQRHAPEDEEAVMMAWYEALLDAGVPDDPDYLRVPQSRADLDAFRAFRHAVPEAVNALARGRGFRKLGTDLAYPLGALHEMMAGYDAALADVPGALGAEAALTLEARYGAPPPQTLDAAIFGHIGDNHVHVNLLPRDALEEAAARQLYRVMALGCVAAGGSLSAEHGIGKSKRALLAEALPPAALAELRAIRDALDPQRRLCAGNLLS